MDLGSVHIEASQPAYRRQELKPMLALFRNEYLGRHDVQESVLNHGDILVLYLIKQ